MKHILKMIAVLVLLTGCGGGGGGGDDGGGGDSEDIAGRWVANLLLSENPCGLNLTEIGLDTTVNPTYDVNQSGSQVVVQNVASGSTLVGTQGANGGFAVTSDQITTGQCVGQNVLTFQGINGDDASPVTFVSEVNCRGATCHLTYIGTAHRIS